MIAQNKVRCQEPFDCVAPGVLSVSLHLEGTTQNKTIWPSPLVCQRVEHKRCTNKEAPSSPVSQYWAVTPYQREVVHKPSESCILSQGLLVKCWFEVERKRWYSFPMPEENSVGGIYAEGVWGYDLCSKRWREERQSGGGGGVGGGMTFCRLGCLSM